MHIRCAFILPFSFGISRIVKAGLIVDRCAGIVLDTLTGFQHLSWWHDLTPPRTSGRDPLIAVRGLVCRSGVV
jgi:hypothetical protein